MYYQIKPNDSTRTPGQHIALQVVSSDSISTADPRVTRKTFVAVAGKRWRMEGEKVTREQSIYHEELADFWEWLYQQLNLKIGTWVWCDNLVTHLWLLGAPGEMDAKRMIYERSVLGPKVSFLRASTERGSVLWLDRCNWWRCPIADLIDTQLPNGYKHWSKRIARASGEFDAQDIVHTISENVVSLCQFVRCNDLGCLRVTASGQSLAAYRHRLGPRRTFARILKTGKRKGEKVIETRLWPRRHDNKEATDIERAGYYGGPTHCYFIGKVESPVYVLDVRSIYPFVMKRSLYPCELIGVEHECSVRDILDRTMRECVIARVKIRGSVSTYPLRRQEGTFYVTGDFVTTLPGPELCRAAREGRIEKVYSLARYSSRDLFSSFIDYFYSERKRYEIENKPVWADLCKLILNSLGSKFGQLTGEWRDDPDMVAESPWGYWPHVDADSKKVLWCRGISNGAQVQRKRVESAHSFPAIPAYMCSYARVYMNELISIAQAEGKVYYSAVDSIHCDLAALAALDVTGQVGNELGQLRIKTVAVRAEYRGVGDYTLNSTVTKSGLATGALPACPRCRESIYPSTCWCAICKVPWDNVTYCWPEQESATEAIDRGPSPEILQRVVTVRLPSNYKFGRIKPDGWVEPWELPCSSLSDTSAETGE